MPPNFTEIGSGAVFSKGMYAFNRHFLDKKFAKMTLYKPADYTKDLIKAGYVRAVATDTDDDIATAIMSPTGYKFAGGPANLVGDQKLTATSDTYMAAVGQKVSPWQLPSFWLSGITGVLLASEAQYNLTGADFTRKHELGVGMAGVNLVVEGVSRALSIGSPKIAPTGFDVTPGTLQHLSGKGTNVQAFQALTRENQMLKSRLGQMNRPATPTPTATLAHTSTPQPQVQELPETPQLKSIKDKFGLMDGEQPQPAVVQGGGYRPGPGYVTPLESMKKQFGLMSFEA
ncbi:MAG: hypothetical protein KAS66_06835 [Candidatus Omnitrophica bacterium]|nr:hypothetical protein [Candidatus Omnitrophota bacterium]